MIGTGRQPVGRCPLLRHGPNVTRSSTSRRSSQPNGSVRLRSGSVLIGARLTPDDNLPWTTPCCPAEFRHGGPPARADGCRL